MANSAKIVRKIIIQADIRTCSPLRIGSGETDGITDILILKDKQGRAFIPATSLAGVLRDEMTDAYGKAAAEKLFGSIEADGNQSMINISDIILGADNKESRLIHRDSLKIDEITGVGEKGAKYDFEALDRGAEGALNIEITLRLHDLETAVQADIIHDGAKDIYSDMAYTVADLLTSGVQVGSLTTKGYGEIKSAEPAECCEFDFAKNEDAAAWLAYLDGRLPCASYLGKCGQARLGKKEFYMQAEFLLQSGLIVRDYDENNFPDKYSDGKNKITAVQMTSGGDYVIPGTSVKGALRNKAFDILMSLTGGDEEKTNEKLKKIMGFADEKSGGRRSSLHVKDIYIGKDKLYGMKQARNRIDRFTGGTIDSALFSEEPVWQREKDKPAITLNLRVKDCDEAQAGLMLLLLRELWTGSLPFGGGRSVGRGALRGQKCRIQYKDESGKEHLFELTQKDNLVISGDKDLLELYVQKLAGECNG